MGRGDVDAQGESHGQRRNDLHPKMGGVKIGDTAGWRLRRPRRP